LNPNGKIDRRALPIPDTFRIASETFVAPRNEIELQLAILWEKILGITPVGVRDNFFDLGGHSMLAVRLFLQIEQVFGQKLPLATLFQTPTVEALSQLLGQEKAIIPTSSLVALQTSGSKRPIFCIPGNLGNVFVDLKDLVRHLDPDQPVYGLQDGPQNPTRIRALAAHYLAEIRTVQPDGPYRLAGICSGGVIAFEMAQQLQAAKQSVDFLALIEPSPPPVAGPKAYLSFIATLTGRALRRARHHLDNFSQGSRVEQREYLGLKRKLFGNMWAKAHYTANPYLGNLTLFLTKETLTRSDRKQFLAWRNLALAETEIVEIPGTHSTITGDNDIINEAAMRALARALSLRLNR
jgi:thioesterase domain-containing protein/acyl carrier protein